MGEIRVKIKLENLDDRTLSKVGQLPREAVRTREIEAIVDTGAVMVLLPQDVVESLGLEPKGRFVVSLADDQRVELPCAGNFALTVAGREMVSDCLVGPPGCQPLIGQLVMERLDLIPDPLHRVLTVRPESPLRPTINMRGAAGARGRESENRAAGVS